MRNLIFTNLMLFFWLVAGFPARAQNPSSSKPEDQGHAASSHQSATSTQLAGDAADLQTPDLTEQVARDVLSDFQRGIESHSVNQVLSVFDPQYVSDYAGLRSQLRAFFRQYDTIQFRYQVLQATAEKGSGFATADIDMDAIQADEAQVPLRRTLQMRFQMKLGPKGWKVVGFRPSDFFAQ